MEKQTQPVEQWLANLKIKALNDMQLASTEANRQHADVILLSDTGSGKTLAFLLPILELLDKSKLATQALVIVPSRELALQIEQVFRTMGTGYKVTCCYGGHEKKRGKKKTYKPPAS